MVLAKGFDYTCVMLSDHFVVSSIKRATSSTFIGENKHTHVQALTRRAVMTRAPINSDKAAVVIILCGVLLVTHRWFLYLVFVFLLGAICTREALHYDFLIAEKVNSCLCFHPAPLERPPEQKA